MGWLELIFGKKTARTMKQVHKATAGISGKPTSGTRAKRPKIEWRKSENGNDTAEIDGFRVTIFRRDDEWNYCIAEILDEEDIADGVDDAPEFGEGYPTKAEAKKAALEELG